VDYHGISRNVGSAPRKIEQTLLIDRCRRAYRHGEIIKEEQVFSTSQACRNLAAKPCLSLGASGAVLQLHSECCVDVLQ
jgi:hypothetical protein